MTNRKMEVFEFNTVPVSIIINPEFEGIANDQMATLTNWAHHVPYILPQGRTTWENPFAKPEGKEDEERDEDEDEENEQQIEPESGPNILSPVQNDESNSN
jgi:radial spoke head protein 4/6